MPATKVLTDLKSAPDPTATIKPFVKWAGGKSQLLEQFEDLFPQEFTNYIEPMVGGGAVFFHLLNTWRIGNGVFLIDNNPELMGCYRVIKENVESLISELLKLAEGYDEKPEGFFYQVRGWDKHKDFNQRPIAQRAARTVFLNKTCYNGLYRVNSKGQFNTPFGRYKNPTICDEDKLKNAPVGVLQCQMKTLN